MTMSAPSGSTGWNLDADLTCFGGVAEHVVDQAADGSFQAGGVAAHDRNPVRVQLHVLAAGEGGEAVRRLPGEVGPRQVMMCPSAPAGTTSAMCNL